MRLIRYMPEFIRRPWRQLQERRRAASPFWSTYGCSAPLAFIDPRIAIDHQRKFIYFRVPKAANSTVVASLYASETDRAVTDRGEMRRIKKHQYASPSQLSAEELALLADYTAFIIVRHPVKRLLSAFGDKIARKRPVSRKVFRALKLDADSQDIALDAFVGYLEDGGLMSDPHWMPQGHVLPRGFRPVDDIGRVETLAEDLSRILGRIYPEGFKLVDHRPHATGASKVEIDAALTRRIAKLYAGDFVAFGYPS